MKSTTNITCNQCPYLKIIKMSVKVSEQNRLNSWALYCTNFKGDMFIKAIKIRNQDLHNKEMAEITAPFICHLRQQERIKGNENKFTSQIT